MSYQKRKEKRERNKKIKNILIIIFIVYILVNSLLKLFNIRYKTVMPVESIVEDNILGKGIIVKDEKTYSTDIDIDKFERGNEGERVAVGYEVASIDLIDGMDDLKKELKEIEEIIEYRSMSEDERKYVEDKNFQIKREQETILESIQENISKYGKVKELKNIYKSNQNGIRFIDKSGKYEGLDIEALNDRRKILSDKIKSNTISYTTDTSGIISYSLDGLENIFIPGNWKAYSPDLFDGESNLEDKERSSNLKGFKVIDNYYWYTAIKVDSNFEIEDYSESDLIRIRIGENDRELTGRIIFIKNYESETILIVRFNNYLEEFYDLRFVDINIIKYKSEGFKIPAESIVEKNSINGVYVKKFNNIVTFKPIDLIKLDDEYAYINKSEDGYISIDDELFKAVEAYDDIIVKPRRVKEGEILN